MSIYNVEDLGISSIGVHLINNQLISTEFMLRIIYVLREQRLSGPSYVSD